jgi:hypothetical protein
MPTSSMVLPVEELAHVVVSLVEGEEPGVVLRLCDQPHAHQAVSDI